MAHVCLLFIVLLLSTHPLCITSHVCLFIVLLLSTYPCGYCWLLEQFHYATRMSVHCPTVKHVPFVQYVPRMSVHCYCHWHPISSVPSLVTVQFSLLDMHFHMLIVYTVCHAQLHLCHFYSGLLTCIPGTAMLSMFHYDPRMSDHCPIVIHVPLWLLLIIGTIALWHTYVCSLSYC